MINKLFKRIVFLAIFTLLFSMMIGMTVFAMESNTILSGDSTTPTIYTVTYDLNDGSENEEYPLEPLIVASGSIFTLPKRPEFPLIILVEREDYNIYEEELIVHKKCRKILFKI